MVEAGQRLGDDQEADARRDELDGVRGGGGALETGLSRRLLPAEHVVQRMEDDLVGEILRGDLLHGRRGVVLGHHDDGGLGVEGDRAEERTVDRQPDETGVGATIPQHLGRLGRGDREELQRDTGVALVPDPHPLRGCHSGNVREPERWGCFRACHLARLPAVVGGHGRQSWSAVVHPLDTLDP